MDLIKFDDHCQTRDVLMEKIGNLKCPIEAVKGAADIEVLESFLAKESVLKNSQCGSAVPSLLIGFVDLKSLLEFNSIFNHWASRSISSREYLLGAGLDSDI